MNQPDRNNLKKSLYWLCGTFLMVLILIGSTTPFPRGRKGQEPVSANSVCDTPPNSLPLRCGADCTECYFPILQGKRFALVVNQTSCIARTNGASREYIHLADSLCAAGLRPSFIFSPEHGFRGNADAGSPVDNSRDGQTGLDIISLYGNNRKPSAEQMEGLDMVVFDLQDTGCRFYTYLSTLHYVMLACAENNVELLVLDRPNPNDTIDGPLLKEGFRSFVGMHPIPALHGCTLGEMARMILGEHWVSSPCRLTVIPATGWQHTQPYDVPIAPSPNLKRPHAIGLYPSLCLFEGTVVSVGRGTDSPFEVIGYPDPRFGNFTFTPQSVSGASHPPYEGQCCFGEDLTSVSIPEGFSLQFLHEMYNRSRMGEKFFSNARFFDLLAGSDALRKALLRGAGPEDIRKSWQADLQAYRLLREKYLLYK